jgi:uncharacterized Zn-binding protein involved in type VI secretion
MAASGGAKHTIVRAKPSFANGNRSGLAARLPIPPEQPVEPSPPSDLPQAIAAGLRDVTAAAQAMNSVAAKAVDALGTLADPGSVIAAVVGQAVDEKMSHLVSGLAAALGPFPAATLTGLALGIPHAHVKHPPSGPPPLPPIPLPPLGPILLGTNLTVLINGKPTARCGDFGLNPTCCGVVPPLSALYQIVTGSSSVFIGGARAARSGIDITMHCFNVPAPRTAIKLGKLAGDRKQSGQGSRQDYLRRWQSRQRGQQGIECRPGHADRYSLRGGRGKWRCCNRRGHWSERCHDGSSGRRRCCRRRHDQSDRDRSAVHSAGRHPRHDPHRVAQCCHRRVSLAIVFRHRAGTAQTSKGPGFRKRRRRRQRRRCWLSHLRYIGQRGAVPFVIAYLETSIEACPWSHISILVPRATASSATP